MLNGVCVCLYALRSSTEQGIFPCLFTSFLKSLRIPYAVSTPLVFGGGSGSQDGEGGVLRAEVYVGLLGTSGRPWRGRVPRW